MHHVMCFLVSCGMCVVYTALQCVTLFLCTHLLAPEVRICTSALCQWVACGTCIWRRCRVTCRGLKSPIKPGIFFCHCCIQNGLCAGWQSCIVSHADLNIPVAQCAQTLKCTALVSGQAAGRYPLVPLVHTWDCHGFRLMRVLQLTRHHPVQVGGRPFGHRAHHSQHLVTCTDA